MRFRRCTHAARTVAIQPEISRHLSSVVSPRRFGSAFSMDVSTFNTVGEWYAAYRGRVPIQMAAALQRLVNDEGLSFPEAYRRLVERGAIIEIE